MNLETYYAVDCLFSLAGRPNPYQKPDMKTHFVCKLSDGRFVANLISGHGNNRSFVPATRKEDACRFVSQEAAQKLATEHGAKNFTVLNYESAT